MFKKIKPVLLTWSLLLTAVGIHSQVTSLTLEECYTLARENYPLFRQTDLIRQSEAYSIDNATKGLLPRVSLHAQASYQSDVTQVPIQIPGMEIPVISKDQYKLYAEASQTLYDGRMTEQQKLLHQANARAEEQKTEVELYTLKERVNQLFFGILLLDEQLIQTDFLKKDIELGLSKTQAAIDLGIALKSSATVLKAELLKINQRSIEIKATRQAYTEMLGLMTHQTLDENTTLVKPDAIIPIQDIHRPEITWYDFRKQSLAVQNNILTAINKPKVSLFLQGGLGRPALNMLSNDVKGYYIGGLRFTWPLTGFYTLNNERAGLEIQEKGIDLQRETFLFNTNLILRQQNAEIKKLQELLASDDEIIELRSSIKTTALAQMENGVITQNDYLREANAEDNARQNKILHEIQLLMAQYSLQTTSGN
jgi:outer membrane protein TolC